MTYLAFDALCFADCVAAARRWVGGEGGGGWEAFLGRAAVLEGGPRSASIISTSREVDMLRLA